MVKGIFFLVLLLTLMGFWTHLLAILLALGLVGFVVKLFLARPVPWNPK